MARDSTAKVEKAGKATSSGSGAAADGATGDWIPSRITTLRLEELAEEGLIPREGWRRPGAREVEPAP